MEKHAKKLMEQIDRQYWIISISFALSCALLVSEIAICLHRGILNLNTYWTFSIGADIFCTAVCTMLSFSCLLSRKDKSKYTLTFINLLTTNVIALFLDVCTWILQGWAMFRPLNIIVNVLYFMTGALLVYMFWNYTINVLNLDSKLMRIADRSLRILLIPAMLLCLVNFLYPLVFSVDINGFYHRENLWFLSQIYLIIGYSVFFVGLIRSKSSLKNKMIMSTFVLIPLVNQLIVKYTFGFSTQYAAVTVSIVLIYGVLFAEREQSIISTEKELTLATRIQSDMLPSTFPFMPERQEFDIYASMDPAKNVGGDFYDFFFIDNDHLAVVIADVSGKGVPAALYMMASKILIKNCAMTGKSPSRILEMVNEQVCANNREEMFVTVWLGIIDLKSGRVAASNAGHEYPIISKNGKFEFLRDPHSFVIGGMDGVKYKEYEFDLQPGDKLFVYTDGAPEAENTKAKQFGAERLLKVLNDNSKADPKALIEKTHAAVEAFVDIAPQFDDITFLCVEYKGGKNERVNS